VECELQHHETFIRIGISVVELGGTGLQHRIYDRYVLVIENLINHYLLCR